MLSSLETIVHHMGADPAASALASLLSELQGLCIPAKHQPPATLLPGIPAATREQFMQCGIVHSSLLSQAGSQVDPLGWFQLMISVDVSALLDAEKRGFTTETQRHGEDEFQNQHRE